MKVCCTVNGQEADVSGLAPADTLLQFLRDHLGLPGTKNACEQGECGSCAVLVDGVLVCACLTPAGQVEGRAVTTVEGLGPADALDRVQAAFVEAGAVQCGYCTPGLVMAVHALLAEEAQPDDDRIREMLAGNLCRCTGYQKIIDAVRLAAAPPALDGPKSGVES